MLKALKFVQGAVAKKDFNPVLTHFLIKGGRVTGCNGNLTISCPIDLDITAAPRAADLVRAISNCDDTISLHITKANRLAVRSGSFRVYIDCYDKIETFPELDIPGEPKSVGRPFIRALAELKNFVGIDASREWCNTYLFTPDGCVVATNNIIMAQKYIGKVFGEQVAVPWDIAQELIRIGEEPAKVAISDRKITFIYDGGRILQACRTDSPWPEFEHIFDESAEPIPIPDGFFEAISKLQKFTDKEERLYFRDGRICTSAVDEMGASIEVPGLPEKGIYNATQLMHLQGIATSIDFRAYPRPAYFFGPLLRGAMIGFAELTEEAYVEV